MEVILETQGLFDEIEGKNVVRKTDGHVLANINGAVSDNVLSQQDSKKIATETWSTLHELTVGMACVEQA